VVRSVKLEHGNFILCINISSSDSVVSDSYSMTHSQVNNIVKGKFIIGNLFHPVCKHCDC